jgi:hypothetical protein
MKALRTLLIAVAALSLPLVAFAEEAKPTITVTPYGMLHFANYWSGGTYALQDYPGQASLSSTGGSFISSARASRVGLRAAIDDGNWTGAKLSGLLEFDFSAGHVPGTPTCTQAAPVAPATIGVITCAQGPTASNAWYNGLMRLRFASVTAAWKFDMGTVSVLAGQDWGLLNGLHPESLAYYATPLFHNAGNVWRRGPQLRLAYAGTFDMIGVSAAVGAITPVSNTTPVDNGAGNLSRRPDLEGRVGVNVKPASDISVAVGASYASGARRFNYLAATMKDKAVSAFGVDLDANLTGYLQLKGEYYNGTGMDDAYAGIAPAGVGGTTGATPAYVAERGTGFWGQVILKPLPEIWLTAGMGQAQVNKDDLVKIAAAATTRSKNQMTTAGLIANAGKNWRFGVEYTMTTSTYGDFGAAAKRDVKATQIALTSFTRF